MRTFLAKVMRNETLNAIEVEAIVSQLSSQEIEIAPSAALLATLHFRGETVEELQGFYRGLCKHRQTLTHPVLQGIQFLDTAGTGGDRKNSFNISTASALLLASLKIPVAKHGGRAVSGSCGSAEVLERLGISAQKNLSQVVSAFEQDEFIFLYAPHFNTALSKVSALRRSLGTRTALNLMPPLLNPLQPKYQMIGVYSEKVLRPVAELLQKTAIQKAFVMHSEDGFDEFSIAAKTTVIEVTSKSLRSFTVDPKELGLHYYSMEGCRGGDSALNAKIIEEVMQGKKGPALDAVLLNTAAGLVVTDRAFSMQEGMHLAKECIESGRAGAYLKKQKKGGGRIDAA